MDLQIYNKEKASKYLDFYKKNLSKKEYKEILKKFKNSLKFGNFSLSKILLQSRGINLPEEGTVNINIDHFGDIHSIAIGIIGKSISIEVPYNIDNCEYIRNEKLLLADFTGAILLHVENNKIEMQDLNTMSVTGYIYKCHDCEGTTYYEETSTANTKRDSEKFFVLSSIENNITKFEASKLFFKFCLEGDQTSVNCTGCKDCVYFASRYNINFEGGNCNGYAEENGDTGFIEYNSDNHMLKISFPEMYLIAGGETINFKYPTKEVKVY